MPHTDDCESPWNEIAERMKALRRTLAVMESCTGGLLSKTITDVPGCGDFFRGGVVSYATDVKVIMGVSPKTIDTNGVVSSATAAEMAEAVREQLQADVGVGITGVAGPDELEGEPVGTVHIAIAVMGGAVEVSSLHFECDSPSRVKELAVSETASLILRTLESR